MMLSWNCSTLATSCEELTYWKRLWCWEGLGARGEGDDRGWDGWMASRTRWTWIWVNSGSWWWTGRPGMLRFMGSQRVGHDWAELNWMIYYHIIYFSLSKLITIKIKFKKPYLIDFVLKIRRHSHCLFCLHLHFVFNNADSLGKCWIENRRTFKNRNSEEHWNICSTCVPQNVKTC